MSRNRTMVGPKEDLTPGHLRDIAKRIEPAFPGGADELRGIAEQLTAQRDRLRAQIDALVEKAPEQRLLEAIFGTAGCRCGCGAPRWDEDPIVLEHGWDTSDRCGRCGEERPTPTPAESAAGDEGATS